MARIKRTHLVVQPINLNHQLYQKGDSITFGPEVSDEQIKELRKGGWLEGPDAQEILEQQAYAQRQLGMRGLTKTEMSDIWKRFLNLTPEQRARLEAHEARTQDTAEAARLANIAEAEEHTGPVDDPQPTDEEGDDA